MDRKTYEDAKREFLDMSINDRAKCYDDLVKSCGQDFSDAFVNFCAGAIDFSELESNIAEFEEGKVEEGGTTREEGYDRTIEDVAESMDCPIADTLEAMAAEYNALTEPKKEEVIGAIAQAKGEEFSQKVRAIFEDLDFSQYLAKETQVFYNVLGKEFSQSENKMNFLKGIGDFSESVATYATGVKPSNFSIIESAVYLYDVAMKNFSENGELADALQELADGALTPPEAANMAANIEAAASPEAQSEIVEAAKEDDKVEAAVENGEFSSKWKENKELLEEIESRISKMPEGADKTKLTKTFRDIKSKNNIARAVNVAGKVGTFVATPLVGGPVWGGSNVYRANYVDDDLIDLGKAVGLEFSEDEDDANEERTVVREREQNNEMFDALIERYKGLQTDSARAEFEKDLASYFPEETVKYILDRAKGADFSEEEDEKPVADAQKSEAGSENPEIHVADVNKYEELSQKLLGSDAYTVSPAAAAVTAQTSPSLGGTLPEGPVVMGGTTMGEQYQRDSIEDEYKAMGLI